MSRISLVVPLAGSGKRFRDFGFKIPKPLIHIKDKTIIEESMQSIEWKDCDMIFIVRSEDIHNYNIDSFLKQKFGENIKVISVDHPTGGSTESVLMAINEINNDNLLCVWCSDLYFEMMDGSKFDPYKHIPKDLDGYLLTFRANSPNYSYCKLGENGLVEKVVEKQVISEWANTGMYVFKTGKLFVKYALQMIEKNDKSNGEYFLAPLYSSLIKDGLKVGMQEVNRVGIFGTVPEYQFYKEVYLNQFGSKDCVVGLASDHSDMGLKQSCKKILQEMGIKYVDFGSWSTKASDHVTYAENLVRALENKDITHCMTFCKSGQAFNIYMNKFKFIRNALVWDIEIARLSIQHNACNSWSFSCMCLDERKLNYILHIMRETKFESGRHQIRLMKIMGLI